MTKLLAASRNTGRHPEGAAAWVRFSADDAAPLLELAEAAFAPCFRPGEPGAPSPGCLAVPGVRPHRLAQIIADLAAAQADDTAHQAAIAAARERIRDCEARMTRYRAAIDAGGDIAEITAWINAAKAERTQAETALRNCAPSRRMTTEDIRALVAHFAQIGAIIVSADPADKAEIYRSLNLVLTYRPAAQTVTAVAELAGINHGKWVVSCGAPVPGVAGAA